MTPEDLRKALGSRYRVEEYRHGLAILASRFPAALQDIIDGLTGFQVRRTEIDAGGGNKSTIASRLDGFFVSRDWQEMSVELKSTLVLTTRRKKPRHELRPEDSRTETRELDARSHYIDCCKEGVALDIEWNSKDTVFARDLGAFRMLHDLRLVSVGVLVTRGPALQELLAGFGSAYRQKYGATTTHWEVLTRYVEGGASGQCPLVLFGIEATAYVDDRGKLDGVQE
jgi:hypothetical protein